MPVRLLDEPPDEVPGAQRRRPAPLADEAVIVCTTDARTRVVSEAAKSLGLPYVRFRAVFVEGVLQYGGDGGIGKAPKRLKLQPVWISLGDYDNVLAARFFLNFG